MLFTMVLATEFSQAHHIKSCCLRTMLGFTGISMRDNWNAGINAKWFLDFERFEKEIRRRPKIIDSSAFY